MLKSCYVLWSSLLFFRKKKNWPPWQGERKPLITRALKNEILATLQDSVYNFPLLKMSVWNKSPHCGPFLTQKRRETNEAHLSVHSHNSWLSEPEKSKRKKQKITKRKQKRKPGSFALDWAFFGLIQSEDWGRRRIVFLEVAEERITWLLANLYYRNDHHHGILHYFLGHSIW